MRKAIISIWDYFFNHEVNPLRHISDFNTRHMVLQLLGWMWAIAFSLAVGSYVFLGISLLGHAIIIGAVGITVATYSTASKKPELFANERLRAMAEHQA